MENSNGISSYTRQKRSFHRDNSQRRGLPSGSKRDSKRPSSQNSDRCSEELLGAKIESEETPTLVGAQFRWSNLAPGWACWCMSLICSSCYRRLPRRALFTPHWHYITTHGSNGLYHTIYKPLCDLTCLIRRMHRCFTENISLLDDGELSTRIHRGGFGLAASNESSTTTQ